MGPLELTINALVFAGPDGARQKHCNMLGPVELARV